MTVSSSSGPGARIRTQIWAGPGPNGPIVFATEKGPDTRSEPSAAVEVVVGAGGAVVAALPRVRHAAHPAARRRVALRDDADGRLGIDGRGRADGERRGVRRAGAEGQQPCSKQAGEERTSGHGSGSGGGSMRIVCVAVED